MESEKSTDLYWMKLKTLLALTRAVIYDPLELLGERERERDDWLIEICAEHSYQPSHFINDSILSLRVARLWLEVATQVQHDVDGGEEEVNESITEKES